MQERRSIPGAERGPFVIGALCWLLLAGGCGQERDAARTGEGAATAGADAATAGAAQLWRYRNLGRAHFDNDDIEPAIDALGECVRMRPDSYRDHLNLGIALVRGGELAAARRHLERALALEPEAIAAHYVLGIAAFREDDFATARRELERVAAAGAADAPTWFQLARAYRRTDALADAERALRRAIALDPRHVSARYQLFLALRERGALDEARRELEIVKELRRTVPEFLRTQEAMESSVHTALRVPAPPPDLDGGGPALTFEDRTAAWLPAGLGAFASGAILDVEPDGDPDLLLFGSDGSVLLLNDGAGRLRPRADPALASLRVQGTVALGDFDHDGMTDLCAIAASGRSSALRLLLADSTGVFSDATAGSGLGAVGRSPRSLGLVAELTAVDFDHDGDLDLVAWPGDRVEGGGASLALLANEGVPDASSAVRFHDLLAPGAELEALGPETAMPRPRQLLWADIGGDGAVDLIALEQDSPTQVLRNLRQLRFVAAPATLDSLGARGRRAALGDVDGDLREDLLIVGPGAWALLLADRHGGWTAAPGWLPPPARGLPLPVDVVLADLDTDGDLDAVVVGEDHGHHERGPGRDARAEFPSSIVILRNTGTALRREPAPPLPDFLAGVRAADLDRDGALDLVLLRDLGAPIVLRNTTPPSGRLLEVRLRGRRNTGQGTGAAIEVRAGPETVRRVARGQTTAIGIGARDRLVTVRLSWPNGAIQSLIDVEAVAGVPLAVEEKREVAGSCPVLYVWDGSGYRMATDLLGTSPLGFPLGPDAYARPQGEEIVKIPPTVRPEPRDGRYLLSIAEEMREVVYLDRVRLLVVDHPDSIGVFANYVFRAAPFDDPEVVALRALRAPRRAVDQTGRDVTELVARLDRRYPQSFAPLADPFQGVATTQALVLDFGDLGGYRAPVLILSGWTDWTDGPAETAVLQHRELEVRLPAVEVPDGRGGWRAATDWFGFPSLKSKDIMLDLAGRLAAGDDRLRIATNLRAYWDRFLIGERVADRELAGVMTVRALEPLGAELVAKGMAAQSSPDGRLPLVYRREAIRPRRVWRTHTGLATRYGDVTELVAGADDRMVIFTLGDEVQLAFDAALPAPPPGWRRDFFVHSHGWEKEGDYYTALSTTVEPLPFRGMSGYPYDETRESYPLTEANLRYLFEYDTRVIGAQRLPGARPAAAGARARRSAGR